MKFGTIILNEAHKARRSQAYGKKGNPGRLLQFMFDIAHNTKNIILGTATPYQIDISEIWDLLEILNTGVNFVLGNEFSLWQSSHIKNIVPIITGEYIPENESEFWDLLRNPLPSDREKNPFFGRLRSDLNLKNKNAVMTTKNCTDLSEVIRKELNDELKDKISDNLSFFQYHNPFSRHMILRRRKTLEDNGLMPKIEVDIWPKDDDDISIFSEKRVKTNNAFDNAYESFSKFIKILAQQKKGTGFLLNLLQHRLCSSFESALSTAQKFLNKETFDEFVEEDEDDDDDDEIPISVNETLESIAVPRVRTH